MASSAAAAASAARSPSAPPDGRIVARKIRAAHASGGYGALKSNATLATWHYAGGLYRVENAAIAAGLQVDDIAPRLSFFWACHSNFLEEIAKFRAARRMWYRIMTERFGAQKEASKLMRFHTQTGGSTLTAQQPLNNVVRVAIQSMAAVMGGTQSLHTNSYDEALGLPTEEAARTPGPRASGARPRATARTSRAKRR